MTTSSHHMPYSCVTKSPKPADATENQHYSPLEKLQANGGTRACKAQNKTNLQTANH